MIEYLNPCRSRPPPGAAKFWGQGRARRAWYDMDFAEANRLLMDDTAPWIRRVPKPSKRVLSLILPRDARFTIWRKNRRALEEFTDSYLRSAGAGGRDRCLPPRRRPRRTAPVPGW